MKRTIAALSAAAVLMSAGIITAFGEAADISAETAKTSAADSKKEAEDKGMTEAITLVKSRINIPEEYSEFSYSAGEYRGVKHYDFYWRNPAESGQYSATVEGGIITDFYSPLEYNNSYSVRPAFANFSKKDFINKAMSWVYSVNPEIKGCLTADEDVSLIVTSNRVRVSFKRNYGGTEVSGNSINVTLDKFTGDVWSYSANWWQNAKFQANSNIVSQADIKNTYVKEVTIKPWYRINTDADGKKTAVIVYEPQSSFTYDAFTGKHSTMDSDYAALLDTDKYAGNDFGMMEEEAVAEDAMAVETAAPVNPATGVLTEEEKKAVADLSKMLSSAQFKELLVKDKYLDITDKYLINNFSISENDDAPCGFAISCNALINNKDLYRNVYITADAETGKIISFDYWGGSNESSTALNVKSANALAEAAAEYYYGDIFGEYKADPENTAPVVNTKQRKDTVRTIRYYRYVNNIQVSDDYINIRVTSNNKVTSISRRYTNDIDFGDGKIITKDNCLSLLCKQQDMALRYEGFTDYKSVPHTYLSYTMKDWHINARTGKLCDYYGNEITKTDGSSACPYTDIGSSPYKNEIQTLYDYNITTVEGSTFSPKEAISADEMALLLSKLNGYVPLDVREYSDGTAGVNTASGNRITRLGMAKIFTEYAGFSECASFTSIYKSPFKDVKDSDPNIGNIALAYALGIIEADRDGNFHPASGVSREYAYHCVYNYIKNGQDK